MDNPIKIHDFGGTPIFGNTHLAPSQKSMVHVVFFSYSQLFDSGSQGSRYRSSLNGV